MQLTEMFDLEVLLYRPLITPDEWLTSMPWVEVEAFGRSWLLMEPSSTFFVYFLGIITIICGIHFLRIAAGQKSRRWWGISLILWGLGALSAGTSYQIFSYELKCAGREYCVWTSYWEIAYLLLSVGSLNAMMAGQAYCCSGGRLRRGLLGYAAANMLTYTFVLLLGCYLPQRLMISFELMLLFLAPSVIAFVVLNAVRYARHKLSMDAAQIGTWVGLGLVIVCYYGYFLAGCTEKLWARGIWFSANDVLHITLIFWMIYIVGVTSRRIHDFNGEL